MRLRGIALLLAVLLVQGCAAELRRNAACPLLDIDFVGVKDQGSLQARGEFTIRSSGARPAISLLEILVAPWLMITTYVCSDEIRRARSGERMIPISGIQGRQRVLWSLSPESLRRSM